MTDPPRKPPRPIARIGLSALEWRAYLAAALAAVYVAVWLALVPRSSATKPTPPEIAAPAPSPARTIWLDELPAKLRPPVVVPAGWVIATRTGAAPTAIARTPSPRVRVAPQPSRTVRIRTRSS